MLPYLVAFGLLAHLVFWGAGLAILAMPRRWVRFWPLLAAPAGAALQSLVVWVGAYANLHGTRSYAWPAEALPVGLLLAGLFLRRAKILNDLLRLGAVAAVMAIAVLALVYPMSRAAPGLTTISLGNCDAADYAAGARVLMDFAHSDRTGYLGLTEAVQGVLSVDNFFDFWLRINHFTPSALIAFNGVIFHCAPYEITGLITAALLAALIPIVFWMARALVGHRPWVSVGIAAVFGFSPIMWYAVFEVATAQLLGAAAVGLITWAGVALWRSSAGTRRPQAFFGVLAVAYALILGSYNFMVIVCFVPALAYAGGLALWTRQWARFGRWCLSMILPFVLSAVVFWTRAAGLLERFRLFATFDFGWKIPALSPEGWLGIVTGPGMEPYSGLLRLALAVIVMVALAEVCRRGLNRGNPRIYLVATLTIPILIGYGYLVFRGVRLGTNASYDAYKLFTVFYPVTLSALFVWLFLAKTRGRAILVGILAAAVVLGELRAAGQFYTAMEGQPLVADRNLVQLGKVETLPWVSGVNMRLGDPNDMWARLWANSLLLKKAQYYPTDTYEGRWHTALKGDWDLDDGIVSVRLPSGDTIEVNADYSLEKVASPYYLRAQLGKGWYSQERLPRSTAHWRWCEDGARIVITNLQHRPLLLSPTFDGSSLADRSLQIWENGRQVASVEVGREREKIAIPSFAVPPGATVLELRTDVPPTAGPGADLRKLCFMVYGITLDVGDTR